MSLNLHPKGRSLVKVVDYYTLETPFVHKMALSGTFAPDMGTKCQFWVHIVAQMSMKRLFKNMLALPIS